MNAFARGPGPLVLALGLFVLQMLLYLPYLTDDTYIYVRFAENLARHGQLAFNLGEPVHAATSPLWAGLGALGVMLGFGGFAVLKLLGMVLGAATLPLFHRALRRHVDAPWAALGVVAFACEPWFVRWSASGMETSLAVFLLAIALEAGWRAREEIAWKRMGLAVGLLPLVRPETLLLWGLLAVAMGADARGRRSIAAWVGMVLPLTVWAALALPVYGHLLPATLQAKSTPLGWVPARLLANLKVLAALFAIAGAVPVVSWGLGSLQRVRAMRWRDGQAFLIPAFAVWTVLLPVVYLVRDVQVVSRYLEVILIVVYGLGVVHVATTRRSKLWAIAWGLQILVSLGLTYTWIAPSARDFGRSLDEGLGEVATWLVENTAEDAEIAIYDIGLVGARSGRRILDLGGLVHPGINDLRNRVDDAEILHDGLFLQHGDPAILVDRDPEAHVLDGVVLGGRRRCETVLSVRVANLGLSRAEPVVYTVYRLVSVEPPNPR